MTSSQDSDSKQALKPVGKLPVFKTTFAACRFLFRNLKEFWRAALLPVLLALALDLLTSKWVETSELADFVVSLVHSVPETMFSVAWYQFYLAGSARAAPKLFPSWTFRYWIFLGYTLAFNSLIYAIIDGPWWNWNDVNVFVIALAAIVAALYVTTRFSLIFPAISIGQAYGLGQSWRLTTGNGWRILFACWLIIIPLIILLILIEFSAGLGVGGYFYSLFPSMNFGVGDISFILGLSLAKEFILVLVNYGVIGICVVVTSIAYCFCTGFQPPASGSGSEA